VREGGICFLTKSKYWEKSEILGKKILTLTQGGLGNNKPDPPCVKKIPVKKLLEDRFSQILGSLGLQRATALAVLAWLTPGRFFLLM